MVVLLMTKEFRGCLLIDFDGTVVEHEFPNIGKPMDKAFEVLKELQEYGYKLILWTCREDGLAGRHCLTEAIEFCRKNGVEFDSINAGIPEHDWRGGTTIPIRKPHAICHIDDHNLGGFPGWEVVRKELLQ